MSSNTSWSRLFPLLLRLLPYPLLGLLSVWLLYIAIGTLPSLSNHDNTPINLTSLTSIHDVHRLAVTLRAYSNQNFSHVLLLFSALYLFKQAFCLPGAAALNVIAGSLYGPMGTILVIILTCMGTTLCYLLSQTFASPLLHHLLIHQQPHSYTSRLADTIKIHYQQGDLVYYLLFLRLFPLTPNWFLNLASPIVGISLPLFMISVTLGLIPYNMLTTQAGSVLTSLHSFSDIIKPVNLLQLAVMATSVLIPVIIQKYYKGSPSTSSSHLGDDNRNILKQE